MKAASLRIAERYINAFGNVAKQGTTLLLPTNASNPASMMAQGLNIYKSLIGQDSRKASLLPELTANVKSQAQAGGIERESHPVVCSLQNKKN